MRWPGASGRRRLGQEPTDRTLPFRPESLPVSVSHDADLGASSFHQTKMAAPGAKAAMTIPSARLSPVWMPQYMRAKQRAQFEEKPHRRVQCNPGRHRSLRQRIPPPCELTLWPGPVAEDVNSRQLWARVTTANLAQGAERDQGPMRPAASIAIASPSPSYTTSWDGSGKIPHD